jgi:hypothetical protein
MVPSSSELESVSELSSEVGMMVMLLVIIHSSVGRFWSIMFISLFNVKLVHWRHFGDRVGGFVVEESGVVVRLTKGILFGIGVVRLSLCECRVCFTSVNMLFVEVLCTLCIVDKLSLMLPAPWLLFKVSSMDCSCVE